MRNPFFRLSLALICLLAFCSNIQMAAQPLSVELTASSLETCATDIVDVVGNISNGIPPFSVSWTADPPISFPNPNGLNQTIELQDTTEITLTVTDSNNATASASITINVVDDCVWPGDSNNDGMANHLDFMFTADALTTVGIPRPNASIEWIGQMAPDWNNQTGAGLNYKFFDADGNGIIETNDTLALVNNYGLIHGTPTIYGNGVLGDIPLYFDFPNDSVTEGQLVEIPIILGQAGVAFTPIEHIAFRIPLQLAFIDTPSISFSFDPGWFSANPNMELTFNRLDIGNDYIDCAFGRINSAPAVGNGPIATLRFVMEENIAGRQLSNDIMLNLDFSDVVALGENQVRVPVFAIADSLLVTNYVGIHEADFYSGFNLYPNPNSGMAHLENKENLPVNAIKIYDHYGRLVNHTSPRSNNSHDIDLRNLSSGIYYIKIISNRAIYSTKIILQ